jgi:hypothetical protein
MAGRRGEGVGLPNDLPRRGQAVPGIGGAPRSAPTRGETASSIIDPGQVYSRKRIRRLTLDLGVGRINQRFEYSGTVFWVSYATSNDALIEAKLDDFANDPITMARGSFLQGVPFQEFFITNDVQAGESLEIIIIRDTPDDFVTLDS